jgi:hypothetical protein
MPRVTFPALLATYQRSFTSKESAVRPWNEELERRNAIRVPKRLPCALWVSRHRYDGVVEQVSPQAVVVRLPVVPPDLREAKLTFPGPDGMKFALRARPVRGHTVAHTLSRLLPPSLVLHLDAPTDAYLRWVDALRVVAP